MTVTPWNLADLKRHSIPSSIDGGIVNPKEMHVAYVARFRGGMIAGTLGWLIESLSKKISEKYELALSEIEITDVSCSSNAGESVAHIGFSLHNISDAIQEFAPIQPLELETEAVGEEALALEKDDFSQEETEVLGMELHEANHAIARLINQMDSDQEVLEDCLRELKTINSMLRQSNEFAVAQNRSVGEPAVV